MPCSLEPSPHRGETILALGVSSLVCSVFGAGLVAIPLGIVVWGMAHKDLAAIRAGKMDPAGLKATKAGKACGVIGLVLPTLLIGEALLTDPDVPFPFSLFL